MRGILLFALSFLFVCSTALTQEQTSPVGTWKMVSMKWTKGDSTVTVDGKTINHNKIITPTHYATLTQNMDGTFRRAEGGKVKFDDSTFSEHLLTGTMHLLLERRQPIGLK